MNGQSARIIVNAQRLCKEGIIALYLFTHYFV